MLLFATGVVAAILIYLVVEGPPVVERVVARYHTTSEESYVDIRVDGNNISYTYADLSRMDPKLKERWVWQSPMWSKKDLVTVHANLSNWQLRHLVNVINESSFLGMPNVCGKAEGGVGRYYGYELSAQLGYRKNEVLYKSSPDASAAPESFGNVERALIEIARSKFGQKKIPIPSAG
jgi:hypothetical protein